MRNLSKSLALCALVALFGSLVFSCKPNQAAYKKAYESTVARRDSLAKADKEMYGNYREMIPRTRIKLGEDTLEVRTERIAFTKDGGAVRDSVERYNVVVGRFKQIFNARQMRERLMASGYPKAFVLNNSEPQYYVVASTWSTAQGALDGLNEVKADTMLKMRDPLPFVLEPAHMRR